MRFPVLVASLVLVFNAGCGSGPRGRGDFPPPGEGPRRVIQTMTAKDTFFDGTLVAEITVGPGPRPARSGEGGGGGDRGGPPGGGGGGMRMGGGGGMGGGGPEGGGGRPGGGNFEVRPSMRESNQPPAMINLTLTNRGAAPVSVEVYEFNSLMGNFAVRPAKITIAPGASASVDPMTTRLGITGDEIPVIVELRAGGKADRKTLTLHFAPANPSAPPPAPTP